MAIRFNILSTAALIFAINFGAAQGFATGHIVTARQKCFAQIQEDMGSGRASSFSSSGNDSLDKFITKYVLSSTTTPRDLLKRQYSWGVHLGYRSPYALNVTSEFKNETERKWLTSVVTQERNDADFFSTRITFHVRSENKNVSITQTYDIDKACSATVYLTHIEVIQKFGDQLQLFEQTRYASLKILSPMPKTITVTIPKDLPFEFDTSWSMSDKDEWKNVLLATTANGLNIPDDINFPIIHVFNAVSDPIQHWDPLLHRNVQMSGGKFNIQNSNYLRSESSYFSDESEFALGFNDDRSENWRLPQDVWKQGTLKRLDHYESLVAMGPLASPGEIPAVVEIDSSVDLNYRNLSAYWSVAKSQPLTDANNRLHFHYILVANDRVDFNTYPTVSSWQAPRNNRYLRDSEMVQPSLPAISKIAEELRRDLNPSANSMEVAAAITKLLGDRYHYDSGAVEVGGSIEDLPTSKLLLRPYGTCQNFSNLFAAIARSMGIPARIVVGFYADDSGAFRHAWNEIEISPNVWMPLDPQSAPLKFNPGFYLPVAVQMNDADSDKGDPEYDKFYANPLILIRATTPAKP